jgi:hypothetical protein
MNPLQPLADLRDCASMPKACEIFLGLGIPLAKRNALTIPIDNLPTVAECAAVAGLDVVLCFHGYSIRYGILWKVCTSLLAGLPRRLMLVDFDFKKTAFLKLGRRPDENGKSQFNHP